MIFCETFVEHLPDAEGTLGEDLRHLLPIFFTLPCDQVLFLTFGQLLQRFFGGTFQHFLALVSAVHPLNQKINDQYRIHLEIGREVDPRVFFLDNHLYLFHFFLFTLLLLFICALLLLPGLLLPPQSLLMLRVLLFFTHVPAAVGQVLNEKIQLLHGLYRQCFFQYFQFLFQFLFLAGAFELLAHLVVEDEIGLLYQNIQNFTQLLLGHRQLRLLLLLLLVLDHQGLLLGVVLFGGVEGEPVEAELLVVDHLVALDDPVLEFLDLLLVHRLDLVVTLQVGFLEVLELPLELLELPSYALVVRGQLLVGVFEFLVLFLVLSPQVAIPGVEDALLLLQLLVVLVVLLLLLLQDLQIVVQLLSIQLVQGLHLLVALLEVLDVVLHLDLRAREGLHTLHPQLLYRLLEFLLLTATGLCEGTLHVDVLLEAFVHLGFCLLDIGLTFRLESALDLVQLLDALVPKCEVLLSHFRDQKLDVGGLLLEGLGVLIVLLLQLLPKLRDQLVLGSDDQLEGLLLLADGLREGLALLVLFQLRPFDLEGRVLLVRRDGFLLDGDQPLLRSSLIEYPRVLLQLLVLDPQLDDRLVALVVDAVHAPKTALYLPLPLLH